MPFAVRRVPRGARGTRRQDYPDAYNVGTIGADVCDGRFAQGDGVPADGQCPVVKVVEDQFWDHVATSFGHFDSRKTSTWVERKFGRWKRIWEVRGFSGFRGSMARSAPRDVLSTDGCPSKKPLNYKRAGNLCHLTAETIRNHHFCCTFGPP